LSEYSPDCDNPATSPQPRDFNIKLPTEILDSTPATLRRDVDTIVLSGSATHSTTQNNPVHSIPSPTSAPEQEEEDEDAVETALISYVCALSDKKMSLKVVEADGNCLYRCFAHIFLGDEALYAEVKAKCMTGLRDVAAEHAEATEGGLPAFLAYVARMSLDKSWAGDNEIAVSSTPVRIDLLIHCNSHISLCYAALDRRCANYTRAACSCGSRTQRLEWPNYQHAMIMEMKPSR
jgi:hypothetical protein